MRQCGFCMQINLISVGDEHLSCKNCGLSLARRFAFGMAETEGDKEASAAQNQSRTLPEKDAEPEVSLPDSIDSESVETKRIPKWAIAASVACLLVLSGGVVVSLAVLSTTSVEATPEDDAAAALPPLSVTGWDDTPIWVSSVSATQVTESSDGSALGLRVGDTARVIDAETGRSLATQALSDTAAPIIYRVGDALVTGDADAAYLWTDDTGDDAGWRHVDVPGDATLTIRGDAALAVTTVGASYQLINNDATLSPLPVPTEGAVPVAATGDTIIWGTNARVAHVTDRDGKVQGKATVSPPSKAATIDRWVGGDATHVYVLWEQEDTLTLAVHDTATGEATATYLISEAERDATPITTRDGATVAFATLLINTTTGDITKTETTITGVAGDRFIAQGADEAYGLVDSAGTVRELGDQNVVPVAGTQAGQLVVAARGTLAALDPDPGTTGQTKSKENNEEVDE